MDFIKVMDASTLVTPVRISLVDPNPQDLLSISESLAAFPNIEIVGETTSYSQAYPLIDIYKPDFLLLALIHDAQVEIELIQKIRQTNHTVKIVVLGQQTDADEILQCMRVGADGFLIKPIQSDEVRKIIDRFRAVAVPTATDSSSRGKVIAILGSRGGCGATTVAYNLAQALQIQKPTVLFDLHFAQGDLSIFCDLKPSVTISDLIHTYDSIDESLIDHVLLKDRNGVSLLVQPIYGQNLILEKEILRDILWLLRKRFGYILLDLGRDEGVISLYGSLFDDLYLITNPNLPSIYLTKRKLQLWNELGYDRNCVHVVVNAYNKKSEVTLDKITKSLELDHLFHVRSDEANVQSAMNRGIPLPEISRWGKAYNDIITLANAIHPPAPKSGK